MLSWWWHVVQSKRRLGMVAWGVSLFTANNQSAVTRTFLCSDGRTAILADSLERQPQIRMTVMSCHFRTRKKFVVGKNGCPTMTDALVRREKMKQYEALVHTVTYPTYRTLYVIYLYIYSSTWHHLTHDSSWQYTWCIWTPNGRVLSRWGDSVIVTRFRNT